MCQTGKWSKVYTKAGKYAGGATLIAVEAAPEMIILSGFNPAAWAVEAGLLAAGGAVVGGVVGVVKGAQLDCAKQLETMFHISDSLGAEQLKGCVGKVDDSTV